MGGAATSDLRVLVVDDEDLARNDLSWLLDRTEGVGEVLTASSGQDALRLLSERSDIDALFVDIQMPGLDGVELAKVVRNFREPPPIAFVTAYESYAVDAFDLDACDYLLKPVDADRLTETIRRFGARQQQGAAPVADAGDGALPRLMGRSGTRSFPIERSDVTVVEAAGDYVRVSTGDGAFLVRESISSLTSAWSGAGFIRIHRSFLVRAGAIAEVRTVDGRRTVLIDDRELPVSRRYTRLLEDHLGGRL